MHEQLVRRLIDTSVGLEKNIQRIQPFFKLLFLQAGEYPVGKVYVLCVTKTRASIVRL